ncbi:transcriptional regulator, AraC family [Hymenobacter roseosalivarius DSM 11622]|uniref:Transcriptional regulator, AraC family n=1 Tax=Hymenobacter roseosalivarius DSM 11622 TaxID=645990 RepID=A0A1W1W1H3_9BACT|nr:helix-turn-helix domain-containing protein [Hymenobacter roseosalivarius]SMB99467.1 transcriptional regulator, AraC family [Hymenobacter roseosalivarius DSM 11622]
MKLHYRDVLTQGEFKLTVDEADFDHTPFQRGRNDTFLTLAWNNGPAQTVTIDEVPYDFPEQSLLPLIMNQTFHFARPGQVVAWQYNRNFYCIVSHDKEVSCVGFLFYGASEPMFIDLRGEAQPKLAALLLVFIDEFHNGESLQQEMLQMLLKRLIIIVTRLAKAQYQAPTGLSDDKLDTIRRYHLLVDTHFRTQHQVQFYAGQLSRSPKTLANLFALYNEKSPLAVIQERLVLEAKRLLLYSDKSAKEITYELGFEDAAYFSNFFKKHTALAPSVFRASKVGAPA